MTCRLLLIGDTGAPGKDDPVLAALTRWAKQAPERTLVIFLGDNIYPVGMPAADAPGRLDAERRLRAQLRVYQDSGAGGFVVPGNHDWYSGLEGLQRQEVFVRETLRRGDAFFPSAGCPGPVVIDRDGVRLIVVDTMLWLEEKRRSSAECPQGDLLTARDALARAAASAEGRDLVFIAHHPTASHGPHGGFYEWRDHLFPLARLQKGLWLPLPVIGSLYPVLRWNLVRHPQDLNSAASRRFRGWLRDAFTGSRPLIYAAGHEHGLQVLTGDGTADYILVSGAGSATKLSAVFSGPDTLFAHLHEGFMAVDFLDDGCAWLRVIEPEEDGDDVVFWKRLKPAVRRIKR